MKAASSHLHLHWNVLRFLELNNVPVSSKANLGGLQIKHVIPLQSEKKSTNARIVDF